MIVEFGISGVGYICGDVGGCGFVLIKGGDIPNGGW